MVISVRFIGALRGISGKSKLCLNVRKTMPLRDIIKKITEQLPQIAQAMVDPELEDPRPNTLILVNGREISVLDGLETILKDGDEVVFVPVIHGG